MSTLKPGYKPGHLDYSAGKLTNATPMTAAYTNYQDEASFACSVPDLDNSPNKQTPATAGKQRKLKKNSFESPTKNSRLQMAQTNRKGIQEGQMNMSP